MSFRKFKLRERGKKEKRKSQNGREAGLRREKRKRKVVSNPLNIREEGGSHYDRSLEKGGGVSSIVTLAVILSSGRTTKSQEGGPQRRKTETA